MDNVDNFIKTLPTILQQNINKNFLTKASKIPSEYSEAISYITKIKNKKEAVVILRYYRLIHTYDRRIST
jgi:hypothetical protein